MYRNWLWGPPTFHLNRHSSSRDKEAGASSWTLTSTRYISAAVTPRRQTPSRHAKGQLSILGMRLIGAYHHHFLFYSFNGSTKCLKACGSRRILAWDTVQSGRSTTFQRSTLPSQGWGTNSGRMLLRNGGKHLPDNAMSPYNVRSLTDMLARTCYTWTAALSAVSDNPYESLLSANTQNVIAAWMILRKAKFEV